MRRLLLRRIGLILLVLDTTNGLRSSVSRRNFVRLGTLVVVVDQSHQAIALVEEAEAVPSINVSAIIMSAKSGARAAGLRSAVRLLTYPLDTIKTRQQVDTTTMSPLESPYAGAWIAILGQLPAGALLVGSFDLLRSFGMETASASLLAAIPALAVKVPIESLKQKKQAQAVSFQSNTSSNLFRGLAPGSENLYRGALAQAARELGFNSIQLAIFDSTTGTPAYRGAFAAAFAALLTHPFDYVKTTAMTSSSPSTLNDVALAADIFRTQGPLAFTRGLAPRLLHTAIGGAAFFAFL